MRLDEVVFRGYKAFSAGRGDNAELQRLTLAPLTLIFGKNNSGKSVVARLPRLLLGGLACTDERILPLDVRGIKYGGRFVDIIHGGDFFGRPTFEMTARHGEETLDFSATLFSPGALAADEPPRIWEYHMRSPDHLDIAAAAETEASFQGLLPAGNRWNRWRDAAAALLDTMVHLGPTRAPVQASYIEEQPTKLGLDGREAPQWLRADSVLADVVGAWFAEHMEGWRLSLSRSNESFSLRVARTKTMASNLAHAGEGLQQVLPVIVHQITRQRAKTESFLDVVEQPEIHLHAAVQAPLADLFIDTILTGRGKVLVETHSKPLLLRIQRRVAEGILPRKHVALYFVENTDRGSKLRPLEIHPDGEVDWWPEGVFEEDFHEVAAIRRAQRQHTDRGEAG